MNLTYGRQINKQQYSQALKLFLKWIQYFNQHSYGGFIKPIYKSFCQSVYMLDKKQFETIVDEICVFVQYLVKVYTDVYNLKDLNKSPDGKLFKNQNIYNLIMSFMFRKTKIKSFIRSVIRENNIQKIKKFQEKLKIYSKKGIHHFGIDKKFILIKNQEWDEKEQSMRNSRKKLSEIMKSQKMMKNDSVLEQETYQIKAQSRNGENSQNDLLDQYKMINHSNEKIDFDVKQQANTNSKNIDYSKLSQKQQQDLHLLSFRSQIQSTCYQNSIRLFSQLSSPSLAISPISKLKIIIAISKSIMKQIQTFYTQQLKVQRSKIPQIDPDNLTSIVMYLIVCNNNPILFQQLKMIQYFTTTNTLNCISGYYLNMFIAAIDMILELK